MEREISNTSHPVVAPEASENQVPIAEESTWGNKEIISPEKVEDEENASSEPMESMIEKNLQKSENPHVGTTLKNLNFR